MERGREGGREGEREGRRDRGGKGGREGRRKGGRQRGREGGGGADLALNVVEVPRCYHHPRCVCVRGSRVRVEG